MMLFNCVESSATLFPVVIIGAVAVGSCERQAFGESGVLLIALALVSPKIELEHKWGGAHHPFCASDQFCCSSEWAGGRAEGGPETGRRRAGKHIYALHMMYIGKVVFFFFVKA